MEKAMIAMSGGVDSSVCAYLMQCAGAQCAGANMLMCDRTLLGQDCPDTADDARSVAQRLGIPFYVLDTTGQFREQVVEKFVHAYEQGLTPNPCVDCNRHLKFDALLERALALGYDCLATGHYAQIHLDKSTGRYLLYKAVDSAKDQSYFLSCLTQHQLAHTRFPLGTLTKEQVRTIAREQGFVNARKRDSQDICFIPDGDYLAFLERYTGKHYPAGAFLDVSGNVLGQHRGAVAYTLGQRKGLGLAMGKPVYVCAKDMAANTVTVGAEDTLYAHSLLAADWNWIAIADLRAPMRVMAKARYRHTPQPATVYPEADGTARVEFDCPQRALTPGQTVVLYDGDLVIGGGTITQVLDSGS